MQAELTGSGAQTTMAVDNMLEVRLEDPEAVRRGPAGGGLQTVQCSKRADPYAVLEIWGPGARCPPSCGVRTPSSDGSRLQVVPQGMHKWVGMDVLLKAMQIDASQVGCPPPSSRPRCVLPHAVPVQCIVADPP